MAQRTIGLVLFEGTEELDFAGPWEVFSYAARTSEGSCTVVSVSEHGGVVQCAKGLRIVSDHSFEDCPPLDVVLVPGGMGTRTEVNNPAMISFLQRFGGGSELMASVCTGSFVLERAGFLDGRRATTHWASMDRLRALGTVEVVEERFVDTGNVITSAGVSAGIDMALYIVGRLWGEAAGRSVQKGIEYFPRPPFDVVETAPATSA